jgi:hypothetical protein
VNSAYLTVPEFAQQTMRHARPTARQACSQCIARHDRTTMEYDSRTLEPMATAPSFVFTVLSPSMAICLASYLDLAAMSPPSAVPPPDPPPQPHPSSSTPVLPAQLWAEGFSTDCLQRGLVWGRRGAERACAVIPLEKRQLRAPSAIFPPPATQRMWLPPTSAQLPPAEVTGASLSPPQNVTIPETCLGKIGFVDDDQRLPFCKCCRQNGGPSYAPWLSPEFAALRNDGHGR